MGKLHPAIDELAPPVTNRNLDATVKKHGLMRKLSGDAGEFLNGAGGFSTPTGSVPGAHATTHQNGGSDEINVAGLSGVLADPQTPIAQALLDGTRHNDTVAQGPSRGSIIYGNSTPKWDELTVGAASTVLTSNGTDAAWTAPGATGGDFLDSLFRVVDNGTPSKKLAFEVSGVTAATTRTWTVQDLNGIPALLNQDQTVTEQWTFRESAGLPVIFDGLNGGHTDDMIKCLDSSGSVLFSVNQETPANFAFYSLWISGIGVGFRGNVQSDALSNDRAWTYPNMNGQGVVVGNETDPPPTGVGIMGRVNRTAQAAAITSTIIADTPTVGLYLIHYEMTCTTADVTAGPIVFNVVATGDAGSVTTSSASLALTVANVQVRGTMQRYVASGNVTYTVTVTGAINAARYALRARCEFLG